jgi:hypothetical protein
MTYCLVCQAQGQLNLHYEHFRWVPFHKGTARPQVADGGDGLQIWRVAANILNKEPRAVK